MNDCIVSIGSITYAMKARSALAAVSVRTRIVKPSPIPGRKYGCEYGLEFPCERLLDLARELKRQGIEYELISQ